MKALIIDRVSPLVASGLKEYGVEVDIQILPGVEELKQLLPNYDLLVMRVDPKIDRELLDAAAKRVKMIAVCSAGTNHIDPDSKRPRHQLQRGGGADHLQDAGPVPVYHGGQPGGAGGAHLE